MKLIGHRHNVDLTALLMGSSVATSLFRRYLILLLLELFILLEQLLAIELYRKLLTTDQDRPIAIELSSPTLCS